MNRIFLYGIVICIVYVSLSWQVEEESQKTRETVRQAATAQENLLEKVNQHQKEWGHSPLTLPHLPHHSQTQVTHNLNEFAVP